MGFARTVDKKKIHFSNHALDRWWERCEENEIHGRNQALDLLDEKLDGKKIHSRIPDWTKVNKYHRATARGFIPVGRHSGFVVNQNPNGDYVAVTFMDKLPND